ncbi:immunoglobulin domain-containing protein [Clupea harengus]|uniref:immunoglobulin domain-containing protein n=1 Tax=Clupea harengus TaxID=7950 RepID=UPI0012ABE4D4|nr:immunoglobulin domain-containing protein [Clupea harengus]
MAQRLTPRKSFFGALMFLVFPHTGISNKEISISQTNEEAAIILTCHLSGNMTVIQTSWVMSPNRTNVGTFHPVYGTHVLPQYTEHVEILSDPPNSHRSSLRLKNGAMNGPISSAVCSPPSPQARWTAVQTSTTTPPKVHHLSVLHNTTQGTPPLCPPQPPPKVHNLSVLHNTTQGTQPLCPPQHNLSVHHTTTSLSTTAQPLCPQHHPRIMEIARIGAVCRIKDAL